jgi:hypothetical protein
MKEREELRGQSPPFQEWLLCLLNFVHVLLIQSKTKQERRDKMEKSIQKVLSDGELAP